MNTFSKKNILVCPLDWGLGHATRCVPVIREFVEQGANVIIAAYGRPLAFLKKEFPGFTFVEFPGYNIRYPRYGNMAFFMMRSSMSIFNAIRKEEKILGKIISENLIDIVLSDNRFGLHSKKAYCIYMTHQVMIKCPPSLRFLEYLLYRIHKTFIKKYNECWIPDFKDGVSLSGKLSHQYLAHKNTFFIGPLSRFSPFTVDEKKVDPLYDVMVILSGPEPQRSIFEKIILKQALALKSLNFLFVRGLPEKENADEHQENIHMFPHLETEAMRKAIARSELVICRPGYTSIMDIAALNKNAVFVPTPGQTEQEYLARYFFLKRNFYYQNQKSFNLEVCISNSHYYQGINVQASNDLLSKRINFLLEC